MAVAVSGRSGLNARWWSNDSAASSTGNLTFNTTVIASTYPRWNEDRVPLGALYDPDGTQS
jgi:hypothetical protein